MTYSDFVEAFGGVEGKWTPNNYIKTGEYFLYAGRSKSNKLTLSLKYEEFQL